MCRFVPVVEGFHLANFVYISKFPSPFSLFLVTPGVIVINISHFAYRREMRGRALDFVVKFSTKLMESPIRLQPLFSENHSNFKDSIPGLNGAAIKAYDHMFLLRHFPILFVYV